MGRNERGLAGRGRMKSAPGDRSFRRGQREGGRALVITNHHRVTRRGKTARRVREGARAGSIVGTSREERKNYCGTKAQRVVCGTRSIVEAKAERAIP